jgi:hypothetical protein
LEAENMTHADRLNYSKAIADASSKRDAAVRELHLDQRPRDIWQSLHSLPFDVDQAKDEEPQPIKDETDATE